MTPVASVDPAIDTQIRHLIARYVWALDTADLGVLRSLFTEDCLVQDTGGNRHEGRVATMDYFAFLTSLPAFRGRRHHIDNLVYLTCGDECRLKAYWFVEKWESVQQRRVIDFTGHSEDRIVRVDGEWRFAERMLYYWRDDDGPWHGPRLTGAG